MKEGLSNEDKKRLSYERQNAVRKAWKEEQSRVSEGYGTRKWTQDERKEIMQRGAVSGYEGHHMKSVSLYPEYAGDPKNIQFLSEEEHLYGAHGGSYHNLTNGYYDSETQTMNEFDDDELKELPVYELSQTENTTMEEARAEYYEEASSRTNQPSEDDISVARESYESQNTQSTEISEGYSSDGDGYSGGRR